MVGRGIELVTHKENLTQKFGTMFSLLLLRVEPSKAHRREITKVSNFSLALKKTFPPTNTKIYVTVII